MHLLFHFPLASRIRSLFQRHTQPSTHMYLAAGVLYSGIHHQCPPCSDFGYYRSEASGECVEQEEMKGRPLQYCLNGTTEQLLTSGSASHRDISSTLTRSTSPAFPFLLRLASKPFPCSRLVRSMVYLLFLHGSRLFQSPSSLSYRRIPGDQCEGGFQPDRKETDLYKRCTSSSLQPKSLVSPAVSIHTYCTFIL